MSRFGFRTRNGVISSFIEGLVGASFDVDAEAFFGRVTAAGGSLSDNEKNAVNTLTLSLKAAGVWTDMKAIYPMVGASAASCAQNLRSSSFTGTFSGAWVFSSAGAKGNGTNTFMNTQLLPTTQLSVSSAHMAVYNSTIDNGNVIIGNGDLSCFLQPAITIIYGSLATGTFTSAGFTYAKSLMTINRQSSSLQKLMVNNILISSNTATGSAYSGGQNIYVGAYNAGNCTNNTISYASIGSGMTDTEMTNFNNTILTFQTNLSRQ